MPLGAGAGNGIVRPGGRFMLVAFGILAVSAPVSIVATVALFPFWRWLEENFGLESVGHSGPAEWCFLATYLACVALGASIFLAGKEKDPRKRLA